VTRLVRTRATYVVYATLGYYGWYIYGFGPIVPLLRDEQGTSRAVASLHGTALAVGALAAGALYPVVVGRFGRRATLWGTLVGLALGIVVLTLVPSTPPATIAAALVCATTGSVLVNVVAPALLAVHGPETSGAALSEGNAIATGTGLLAPLAIGLSLDRGLGWRPALLVASVFAVVIVLVARLTRADLPPDSDEDRASRAAGNRRPLPRRYWLVWGVMLCCIAGEFATTLWASDVVRDRAGASAAFATGAITAVVGGMCAGRIVGSRLAARWSGTAVLAPALLVALLGTALFWSATAPVPAVIGLACLGLGVGPTYPLAADLATRISDGQPDRAAGYASYAAGLAVGVGPFALGAFADRAGTHAAFLVVPLLFTVAVGGVLAVRRPVRTTA